MKEIPTPLHLFDALYINGHALVDASGQERRAASEQAARALNLVSRLVPMSLAEGEAFAEAEYRAGHEGVMAKDLNSPCSPGVRGKSWLKLKRVINLGVVIVAADADPLATLHRLFDQQFEYKGPPD